MEARCSTTECGHSFFQESTTPTFMEGMEAINSGELFLRSLYQGQYPDRVMGEPPLVWGEVCLVFEGVTSTVTVWKRNLLALQTPGALEAQWGRTGKCRGLDHAQGTFCGRPVTGVMDAPPKGGPKTGRGVACGAAAHKVQLLPRLAAHSREAREEAERCFREGCQRLLSVCTTPFSCVQCGLGACGECAEWQRVGDYLSQAAAVEFMPSPAVMTLCQDCADPAVAGCFPTNFSKLETSVEIA